MNYSIYKISIYHKGKELYKEYVNTFNCYTAMSYFKNEQTALAKALLLNFNCTIQVKDITNDLHEMYKYKRGLNNEKSLSYNKRSN